MDGDVPTLNMFKAIMNIVDLGEPNLDKKIDTLRIAYAKKIQEKGIYYVDDNVSLIIIEGLFNRMYMNTYNKILTKDSDVKKVIKYDDGVPILDAGLEFNFMLTSLAGVDNFFSKKVNMASKWNTASFSRGQGVCVSFINNENLGVITFEAPFLAFANIPQDSLNAMGCCDVFTDSFGYNLRKINDSRKGKNRFFIPGNILADETRYGYNEILLDRFLHNDDNNILKMQPSYVIFYKMDQSNYEESVEYKNSLKMAKDFGIPIMVIDVEKVKQHEKEVILEKEKELFSNIEPKPDLLKEIVNRYMNNYTGSLTIVGEKNNYGWTSYEEFSVSGMKNFFEKLNSFIMKIDDSSLKTKWISSLRDSYLDEKRKYDIANNTENWNNSVKDFILKDFKIESIIRDLLKTVDVDFLSAELLIDGDSSLFLSCENLSPTSQVIIDFVNFLDIGTKIKISDYNKDNINGKVATIVNIGTPEERLIENLICYYFLEDSDFLPIDDLIYNNFELGTELNICEDEDYSRQFNNFNYVVDKLSSNGKDSIGYDFELVDKVITKISTMDDKEFLKIFNPVIEQQSKKNLMTPEEICFTLLDKKGQFKVRFNSLSNQVKKVDNGNGKSK